VNGRPEILHPQLFVIWNLCSPRFSNEERMLIYINLHAGSTTIKFEQYLGAMLQVTLLRVAWLAETKRLTAIMLGSPFR